jgi:hypothetical protein
MAYFYCTIRYQQCTTREECVTVGILVSDGKEVSIRWARNTDRIQHVFGAVDVSRFYSSTKALEKRILEALAGSTNHQQTVKEFVHKEAGSLVMTLPRLCLGSSVSSITKNLYIDLVA